MIDRISTHMLDTSRGVPAQRIPGVLERLGDTGWEEVGSGTTDADGRIGQLNGAPVEPGDFRITLDTAGYFAAVGPVFYPTITVTVRLDGARPHYHLPVLAGTFSHSSYLGS